MNRMTCKKEVVPERIMLLQLVIIVVARRDIYVVVNDLIYKVRKNCHINTLNHKRSCRMPPKMIIAMSDYE